MGNLIKPKNGNVLLKSYDFKENSILVIPDMENKLTICAEVVALSDTAYIDGKNVVFDHILKVGDIVYIPPMTGFRIKHLGFEYMLVPEHAILCVIEKK